MGRPAVVRPLVVSACIQALLVHVQSTIAIGSRTDPLSSCDWRRPGSTSSTGSVSSTVSAVRCGGRAHRCAGLSSRATARWTAFDCGALGRNDRFVPAGRSPPCRRLATVLGLFVRLTASFRCGSPTLRRAIEYGLPPAVDSLDVARLAGMSLRTGRPIRTLQTTRYGPRTLQPITAVFGAESPAQRLNRRPRRYPVPEES